jgi:hypothetical protein
LSQLGQVVLPHELCTKLQQGHTLTDDDRRMVARVPAITEQLLAHIPRLESVREILALHIKPPKRASSDPRRQIVELGAHVLRLALDLDILETGANPEPEPLSVLAGRTGLYDADVLAADVRLTSGTLLVARGYAITAGFIERVRNFPPGTVPSAIRILTS